MSRGFTLLELLVALAVLALLAALLFAGLRTGIDALARVERLAEATEEQRIVQSFLRQRLAAAEPLIEQRPGGAAVAFEGAPDRLRFVATLPAHLGGLPHRLQLWRQQGAGLVLAWEPLLAEGAEPVPAQRRVLDPEAGPLAFAYYGRAAGATEAAWHSEWRDQLALPELVRMEVAGQPPLIVALPRDRAAR